MLLFAFSISSALAQTVLDGSLTAKYSAGYVGGQITFKLSEIATALDTDTATLATQLYQLINKKAGDVSYQLIYKGGESIYDGKSEDQTTANGGGGFWMTQDGNAISYGASAIWYTELDCDANNDAFIFNCGHMPESSALTAGATCTATFVMTYNGKYVNFNITYIVEPAVIITPTEGLTFSGLKTIGSIDCTVTVPQTSSSKSTQYAFPAAGLAAALGVDADELSENFENFLFVQYYDEPNSEMKDSLDKGFTYTTNGNGYYWMQRTDENTGNPSDTLASYANSTDAIFYTNAFYFYEDTIYFDLGQNHNNTEENKTYKAIVYVCNNDAQAYALNITLNVTKSEALPFSQMTCAGTLNFSNKYVTGSSNNLQVTLTEDEIAAIETALNVENGDVVFYSFASEGEPSDNATANAGGFWFNDKGYIGNWGDTDAAMFVEPATVNNFSTFNTGLAGKTTLQDGDSVTASIIIMGETSYYQLNFEFIVKDIVGDVENWKVVATQELDAQLIKSHGYTQVDADGNTYRLILDVDAIKSAIGKTSTIQATDVYTWKTYQEEWVPDSLTSGNSCTGDWTGNGFWFSKTGMERATWGNQGAYAIYIDSLTTSPQNPGVIFYVYPETTCNTSTDTAYVAEMFIINSDNGYAYKLVFNITFVEDPSDRITQVVSAGSENRTAVFTEDMKNEDDFWTLSFDLSDALTALEITSDELVSCSARARGVNGKFASADGFLDGQDGVGFNAKGQMVDAMSEEAVYSLTYSPETNSLVLSFLGEDYPAEGFAFNASVMLVYESKSYTINITVGSSEEAVGINGMNSNVKAANNAIYTLAGQRVSKASKGLYIINGKKVLVK